MDPAGTFEAIRSCKSKLEAAEALLAVVANRGGLTWDAMASYYDVSKQAHHRRLSAKGERLWLAAQDRSGIRTSELQLFDEAVASVVASDGAVLLAQRARDPGWWWWHRPPSIKPVRETQQLVRRAAELYLAGRRPWPSILKRPNDGDDPSGTQPRPHPQP